MKQYIHTLKQISKKISDDDWKNELPLHQQLILNIVIGAVVLGLIALAAYLLIKFWIVVVVLIVCACAGIITRKAFKFKK